MFAESFPTSLVTLRGLNMSLYLSIMRSEYPEKHSYDAAVAQIRKLSEVLTSSEGGLAIPDLIDLVISAEYQDFLVFLDENYDEVPTTVQRIIEARANEERLRRLKESSPEEYGHALRVVSEDEIVAALRNGTIVNAINDDGEAERIRSDENYSAAFLHRPTATAWVDATLLATVIKRFAAGDDEFRADAQGLRLRQVVVGGGELNLNWIQCHFPLGFEGCDFYHWVSADHLTVPWLSFDSCDFTPRGQVFYTRGALNAASLVVDNELRFWGCHGLDQLVIPDAHIGSFSPINPHAEGPPPSQRDFLPVIDGATFGRFSIPKDLESGFRVVITRSVRIASLGGLENETEKAQEVADRVFEWLKANEVGDVRLPRDVWDQLENALRRSQHSEAATIFGIRAARHVTTFEGFRGWLKRVVLGSTVRYFYDNMRALWYLLALFGVAWGTVLGVALFAPTMLVQAPLANEALVPGSWLLSLVDTLVWSFLYSLDLILAPISLGLAQTIWPSSIWLTLLLAAIKGLSLLLLGVFLIGVTGLVERRGRTD
ncbi:hypothetical protein [Pseudoclavibacter sp. AY1F1]|uniref:hypothetical protein n=1 Tax=Pseudoclavibacter sp. AY1F1 TaxID=2080583 RepID=UPI0011B085B2|nr:hypothetical protein [Pseudoclavibacter sp. AY1F1]